MESLLANVKQYCQARAMAWQESSVLGWGQDGTVWQTPVPTAVKAFYRQSNYDVEKSCYQRLAEKGLRTLDGLYLAQLIDFDDELLVIELSIVSPPYLLDFGKAYLDCRAPYDEVQRTEYHDMIRDLFGDDYARVLRITRMLWHLCQIDYVDAKPANICLRKPESE
ncbi:MAG: hypothetical protein JNM18_12720 [Planctomycetaceae bacterium]|nr:hypothetical protein [Planctomycetaceae bacterium]